MECGSYSTIHHRPRHEACLPIKHPQDMQIPGSVSQVCSAVVDILPPSRIEHRVTWVQFVRMGRHLLETTIPAVRGLAGSCAVANSNAVSGHQANISNSDGLCLYRARLLHLSTTELFADGAEQLLWVPEICWPDV